MMHAFGFRAGSAARAASRSGSVNPIAPSEPTVRASRRLMPLHRREGWSAERESIGHTRAGGEGGESVGGMDRVCRARIAE